MLEEITGGMWGLALTAFVLGVAAGIAVAYLWVLRDKRSDVLEHELQKQQSEFEQHLQKVDEHFVRTSELFQEMTENYRAVYEHLAAGANDLCSDRVVARRMTQVEEPPLVERTGTEEGGAPEAAKSETPPQGASGAWDETTEEPASDSGSTSEPGATDGEPGEAPEAVDEQRRDAETADAEEDRAAGTERADEEMGTGQSRR